jgi:hypothetical protein
MKKRDISGMNILDVAIQHLAIEHSLGDMGVEAVVSGVPVAIVEMP